MITVLIPTPLRVCTAGKREVTAEGATVDEALADLTRAYPALTRQLLDDAGNLRRFVSLFADDVDVRTRGGLHASLSGCRTLEILPAMSGGSSETLTFSRWRELLEARVACIAPEDLAAEMSNEKVLLLDVRSAQEWALGHIPGAVHLDRGFLELRIEGIAPERSTRIVCYCESGTRSLLAAEALLTLGYDSVSSLSGGIRRWKQEGREVVVSASLAEGQRRRYARQISMPEVGEPGQQRLAESKVLIVGAGGLGCPASLYLAAAGVGVIGIVDDDVVDESNLQRQILYVPEQVGRAKTASAQRALRALNPYVDVVTYQKRLDRALALEVFPEYDVVVDGTDNFASRYLINDVCVDLGKPVVHGSVFRFEGQVTVFRPDTGPCYRCLHPEAPPPALAPSCAEAGVLGILPGLVGVLQATETLKLLLGIGDVLSGRLVRVDALSGRFRELQFAKDPACASCGSERGHAAIPEDVVCALR